MHGFISNQGLGHSKFVAPCVLYTSFNLPSKERNAKHQDNGTLSLGENNAVNLGIPLQVCIHLWAIESSLLFRII